MSLMVFVFDDEEDIRDVLTLFLQERGYKVKTFSDPLGFNTRCSCSQGERCGDILITDQNMPGLTGLELIKQLIRNGCRGIVRHMAVISGSWTEEALREAKKLGCKILNKPFNIEELYNWLDECEKSILSGPNEQVFTNF